MIKLAWDDKIARTILCTCAILSFLLETPDPHLSLVEGSSGL